MTNKTCYEAVIGLEVHVELSTESKLFCACSTAFGAPPNTQCCPVCCGFPGTLPVLNRRAVEYTVTAGLALHCEIAAHSQMARKQYFYPDLPKAYQISQAELPLCRGGYLEFYCDGEKKRVGITRIHLEEDAGKLTHRGHTTLLDCNRCGVPLLEIVGEPELHSAAEAVAYARQLRRVMRYLGISDCKMEQGSMRFDVNVSVRPVGQTAPGTRCEIKNLNSFSFMQKAICYEIERQSALLSHGQPIMQETRRYLESENRTVSLRKKEDAADYRFFPEPDLPLLHIQKSEIASLGCNIPTLPTTYIDAWLAHGIPLPDAEKIVEEKANAIYFDKALTHCKFPAICANLFAGEILPRLDASATYPVTSYDLGAIADLCGEGTVSYATAKKLLCITAKEKRSPAELVQKHNLAQIRDRDRIACLVRQAIEENPRAVQDYRRGKTAASQAVIGRAMALSRGMADPNLVREIVLSLLE